MAGMVPLLRAQSTPGRARGAGRPRLLPRLLRFLLPVLLLEASALVEPLLPGLALGGLLPLLLHEALDVLGGLGDGGLEEHHQLDLAVHRVPLLEEPADDRDVAQEGHLALDLALLGLDDPAQDQRLPALDEEVGLVVPRVEDGAAEEGLALPDMR